MRFTISGDANKRFIKDLAKRLDMTPKEALDYLITQCRLNGFSQEFQNKDYNTPMLREVQPSQSFYKEMATSEFEIEIDPMIKRMANLIEDF
ncbi:MAG: hypothetical protein AAFW70_04880 [Cyanobacteria bacterium J06635_10]